MIQYLKNNVLKHPELFYYLFFSSLLFAKGIGLYDGQKAFKVILLFAGCCWLFKMVFTRYRAKEIVIAGCLLLLGVITYHSSGDKGLLLYIMMITGAKNVPLKKIFHVGLVTWLISFGGTFFLTATHLINSPFKVHEKFGELIIRWGLGSTHPNVLHVSYLLLTFFVGFWLAERMNLKWLLLLMLGNCYTFLYSFSFTGFAAVTVYLILCAYWMVHKKIGAFDKIAAKAGALCCVLISMVAPLVLSGEAFDILNKLLNTRLRLSKIYLTKYPFSWFGTKIADITSSSATMDCSYVYAYVAYGAIAFAVIVFGYGLLICKLCKEERGTELCIVLACLVAGITEPFLFNTSFKNISLIFFAELIYGSCECFEKKRADHKMVDIKVALEKKKIILAGVLIVGCLIGVFGYRLLATQPERIIVPRSESDLDSTFYEELNIDESEIEEDDLVYGTPKEGTPWMQLTGAAVKLELLRGEVTSGILIGIFLTVLIAGMYINRAKNRYGIKREEG